MRLLVLGGTAWLSREVAAAAVSRDHEVTCLARGSSGEVPAEVRFIRADRDHADAYDLVAGERWEVVVDVARQPGHVRRAVGALEPAARRFLFVSSGSVYASQRELDEDEDAPLLPPLQSDVMESMERYGQAKVADDVCADAAASAVRVVDGVPVAVCFVSDLTETLWDVGVDTIESARRQGHAAAVFIALAAAMAAQGRQPVWAAYEDYWPSLALAARLGFWPVARMVELVAPDGGETAAREAVTGSRTSKSAARRPAAAVIDRR